MSYIIQMVLTVLAIIFGVIWFMSESLVVCGLGLACGIPAAILYLNNSTRREMQDEESIYW
jgi:hypothetical protein